VARPVDPSGCETPVDPPDPDHLDRRVGQIAQVGGQPGVVDEAGDRSELSGRVEQALHVRLHRHVSLDGHAARTGLSCGDPDAVCGVRV